MRPSALAAALLLPALVPAQDALWLTDLGAAQKLAREQGKPMLLLFRCER